MNKYVALLVSALLAGLVALSFTTSRVRSENKLLRDARERSDQSRTELEQTLEAAKQREAVAESEAELLRSEVSGLRVEAQRVRQALNHSAAPPTRASAEPTTPAALGATSAPPLTDANRMLLEFLGEPVDPKINTNPRYEKDGVIAAVQLAAQNAGVSIQRIEVEDSEFPCLVGVFCEQQAYEKLLEKIKTMEGYGYSGSTSSVRDGPHALDITPRSAYPTGSSDQIYRRLMLRRNAFYDKLSTER